MKYEAKELRNIVLGAALLGAGGGGSPVQGNKIVDQIIESGKTVEVRDPRGIADDALVVVLCGLGAPSASKTGWRDEHLRALELFEKNYSKKISYIVPFEIGAGNSAIPLHGSVFMDTPVIDGDGAGRAVPELQLTTFDIYGIPVSPMSIANAEGEGGILFAKNAISAERISRSITQVFGNNAGAVLYPMSGSLLKKVVIPGTYTLCEKAGGIMTRLKPSGEQISEKLQKELGMIQLGKGTVTKKAIETRGAFDYGHIEVESKEGVMKVLFKNENILAFKKKRVIAMAPDLICWLSRNGEPLTNVDVEKGREVIILGLAAHKLMRTNKAINAFKPLYTEQGQNVEYKPIEMLV